MSKNDILEHFGYPDSSLQISRWARARLLTDLMCIGLFMISLLFLLSLLLLAGTPSTIGTPSTNAQVHPQLFTRTIFSVAQEKYGASLVKGAVQEVKVDGNNNRVTGVVVDGKLLTADAVVLALGPWSNRNPLISSLTTISGLKAHSIVLLPKDGDAISAHTLFLK